VGGPPNSKIFETPPPPHHPTHQTLYACTLLPPHLFNTQNAFVKELGSPLLTRASKAQQPFSPDAAKTTFAGCECGSVRAWNFCDEEVEVLSYHLELAI